MVWSTPSTVPMPVPVPEPVPVPVPMPEPVPVPVPMCDVCPPGEQAGGGVATPTDPHMPLTGEDDADDGGDGACAGGTDMVSR